MTIVTAVIVALECANGHATEATMINPEVQADESVTGLLGSQADFCDVCDSPEMETLSAGLKDVEVADEDAAMYRVWI